MGNLCESDLEPDREKTSAAKPKLTLISQHLAEEKTRKLLPEAIKKSPGPEPPRKLATHLSRVSSDLSAREDNVVELMGAFYGSVKEKPSRNVSLS